MHTREALERFAALTRLPDRSSLEEKSRALAEAAFATTACARATVVVFGDRRPTYASVPGGAGFTLRDSNGASARLLYPSLEKFALDGGFFVPRGSLRLVAGVTAYEPQGDLLLVPLQNSLGPVGALVFDVDGPPLADELRELRVFADIAAWMIARERDVSAAERQAKQSALLGAINERARKSLDRQSIFESVVEDVREAFGAVRCVAYERDAARPETVRVLALSEARGASGSIPYMIRISDTWLDRVFSGSDVGREAIGDDPRDASLRAMDVGSALLVPVIVEGRVENALALHFDAPAAFEEIDTVMLRSVASHVGLALANVLLYDSERLRRARAESLERVVRMLRDTQTIEEVLLVFAVTISHEVKLTCAAYEIEGSAAVRRALRNVDAARGGVPERIDVGRILPLLDRDDIVPSSALGGKVRREFFAENEGLLAALRIDGNLWGFVVFTAAPNAYDWMDAERRVYFRMLASHLELALAGALGFERIQQLARALSESNEFKDDLLAMLAHDFKGPLTVILGYCELLMENAVPDVREELETIYAQTQRLVRLSEDAVALAQTQAGGFSLDRTTGDLRDLVRDSVKAHNRDDRISLSVSQQPVPVSLDVARFKHVLDNLLMNALKYSDDRVQVRVSRNDEGASIAVEDRGIGIPADELGTVFARFGRASNARRKGISGSGVGLYVSRKIVEIHGGSLAVTSKEGEGSTFCVMLPLAPVSR